MNIRGLAGLRRRWRRDTRGAAAVEFALIAPVLGVLLAGALDFGGVVFVKLRVENAVSAGANYALVNAAKITSKTAASLATDLSAIVANSGLSSDGTNTIDVNNGATGAIVDGKVTVKGTAANADSCYCPTISGSKLSWGSAASCSSSCKGGGLAGKFVHITASQTYTPFFSNYGMIEDGSISVSVVVQAQ
jgi:Flp pilus assembly protein TadG